MKIQIIMKRILTVGFVDDINVTPKIFSQTGIVLLLAHLVSLLCPNTNPYLIIKVPINFITVFIFPGAVFSLLFSKSERRFSIINLFVESFMLSTIINVIYILFLFGLGISINTVSFNFILIVTVGVSLIFYNLCGKSVNVYIGKTSLALLSMAFILQLILIIIFRNLPHWLTLDETAYIAYARQILLGGVHPSNFAGSGNFFRSDIFDLLKGRFFWTFLLSAFIASTGFKAIYASFIGVMFLPMLALTISTMLPPKISHRNYLRMGVMILVSTNPLLVNFADFALIDLAYAFYVSFSLHLFINSFKNSNKSMDFNISGVLTSLMFLAIPTLLLKFNILPLVVLYIILVVHLIRNKTYKQSRQHRFLFYALIIPFLIYELFIDLPFVVNAYFLPNVPFGGYAERFVVFSLLEPLITLFIKTSFTKNISQYYNIDFIETFFRLIDPHIHYPIISATILLFPIFIFMRKFYSIIETRTRLLILFVGINLTVLYIFFLSSNIGWKLSEITRQSLYLIPLLIVVSTILLYKILSHRLLWVAIFQTICILILYAFNHLLLSEKGGLWIGWYPPDRRLNITFGPVPLIIMTLSILLIVAHNTFLRRENLEKLILFVKFSELGEFHLSVDCWKIIYTTLFVVIISATLMNNLYYNKFEFSNFPHFQDREESTLKYMSDLIEKETDGNIRIILSNAFKPLRAYIDDHTFSNDYFVPPPKSEKELLNFISRGYDGSLIAITQNPYATLTVRANNYLRKFSADNPQTIFPENIKQVPRPDFPNCVLDLRFDEGKANIVYDSIDHRNKGTVHEARWINGVNGTALKFDGVNDYVEIPYRENLTITDQITISSWIRPLSVQGNNVILTKGRTGTNTTNYFLQIRDGEISFGWSNKEWNLYTTKGAQLSTDKWYHILVRHIFGQANSTKIYVNSYSINGTWKGNGDRSAGTSNDPLHLGSQSFFPGFEFYFNGTIDEVRIYNRALADYEIQMFQPVYGGLATPINERQLSQGNVVLYEVRGDVELSDAKSGIILEDAKVGTINSTHVALQLNVYSPYAANLTVMVGANEFLKIFDPQLELGTNQIKYSFRARGESDFAGYDGYYLKSSRVLIIDDLGGIIFNGVVSKFQLKRIYVLVIMIILISVISLRVRVSKRRIA